MIWTDTDHPECLNCGHEHSRTSGAHVRLDRGTWICDRDGVCLCTEETMVMAGLAEDNKALLRQVRELKTELSIRDDYTASFEADAALGANLRKLLSRNGGQLFANIPHPTGGLYLHNVNDENLDESLSLLVELAERADKWGETSD